VLRLVTQISEDEDAEALFATYEAGIVAEVFPFGEQRVKLSSSTLFRQRNGFSCFVGPSLLQP
jgi:hypothetical protein